jgi:hypothetical protein
MTQCLVADLGGMPMVDDAFNNPAIATLACAVRQRLDGKRQPLAAYLQPEIARECYRNASKRPTAELTSVDPSSAEMDAIRMACDDIVCTVPQWKMHFSLPLRWRKLVQDWSSSSNPLIPQHIFLGERGIRSYRLREYIVHEVSHIWVGLIAEVAPLAERSDPVQVLPSGTAGKDIGQVIYALTFAATALRFYRALIAAGRAAEEDLERLRYLENYTCGCLQIVEPSGKLTPSGTVVAASCRRILHS